MLAPALQASPSVVQVPVPGTGWQVRGVPLQMVEQQSAPVEQAMPSDLQAVALQVPLVQLPEQQLRLEVQAAPVPPQNELAHLPPEQVPEQHWAPVVQAL